MTTTPAAGSRVLMSAAGRKPRVVHQLERVKQPTALYPYVMACGYSTSAVEAAPDTAPELPCRRCWPDGIRAEEHTFGYRSEATKSGAPATAETAPGRVSDLIGGRTNA